MAQKKTSSKDSPFLKTAAEAIGIALGRLAVRTGVVTPPNTPKRKKSAPKKRTVASKSGVVPTRAKKPTKKAGR